MLSACAAPATGKLDIGKGYPGFVERRLKLGGISKSSEDSVRANCLQKLRSMILLDPNATELGSSLVDAAGSLMEENLIVRSFIDSFAPKATSTLLKRTQHLWAFCEFVLREGKGSPLHFREPVVYDYLETMRQREKGPTSPSSFLEAIHFLHGIARLTCFGQNVLLSARCIGLAKSEMHKKRVTVQSAVLSTDMVWRLERYVVQQSPSLESFIGGHMLFCLYACSRWDDAQHLEAVERTTEARVELVETSTRHHKTAMAAKDKSMLLPLICLGQCLHTESWAAAWLRSKDRMELPEARYAMPTFDERRGCFGRAKMSSSEATLWLRDLLVRSGTHPASVEKITSHGLKATLLSWVAKSGRFSQADQRCLGHHFDRSSRSVLIYSRDTYAPLAAKIRLMLDSICGAEFNPDASRAKRASDLVEEADPPQQEYLCSSSESELDAKRATASTLLPGQLGGILQLPEGWEGLPREHVFVHNISGVMHVSLDLMKFGCGRRLSDHYTCLTSTSLDAVDLQACKQCGASKA